jgi:predicted ATPase
MRRFVITGAPGAGKTAIIRQLELEGFSVVDETATDVIAAAQAQGAVEPWRHPRFSMQSLICKGIVRFERHINQMKFSFTIVTLYVLRHCQCF